MPFYKNARKVVRRNIRRGARNVRRRYYNKKKGVNLKRIYKDIAMVKGMLNSEKKHIAYAPSGTRSVAQIFSDGTTAGTGSGHDVIDLTSPGFVPVQGVGQNERTGSSIRVCSHILRMQFFQESNTNGPRVVQIYIIRTQGDIAFSVSEFLNPNTFIENAKPSGAGPVYDNNSRRNQDFYKQFRVLARRSIYLKNDDISGETVVKNLTIPLKFKEGNHMKFQGATDTVVNGRTYMLLLCNAGNEGSGTPSGFSFLPTAAADTGVRYSYTNDYYYYDN